MRKALTMFLMVAFSLSMAAQAAEVSVQWDNAELVQMLKSDVSGLMSDFSAADLIEWKVGDEMSYDVTFGSFGKIGTSVKKVTSEEGRAIWVKQTIDASSQHEVVDVLINRADGKILKMLRNGQEQSIPDDKLEIIEQKYETITVPAGKFDTMHIVAKTKDIQRLDVWMNPVKTVMDGTIKQKIKVSMGEIGMVLTRFTKIP